MDAHLLRELDDKGDIGGQVGDMVRDYIKQVLVVNMALVADNDLEVEEAIPIFRL